MQTSIEPDEALITQAMKLGALPTRKAALDEALKLYIELKKQAQILKYRGKLHWEGDLDAMRRDA